jgi:hypothetical protein
VSTSLAAERAKLRSYLNDDPADHQVIAENVGTSRKNRGFIREGAATLYLLEIGTVASSVQVSVDRAAYRAFPNTGAGESIDLVKGGLTFTEATKAKKSLAAHYQFQWFTDANLDDFLKSGTQWLQYYGSVIDGVPDGLLPAVKKYAAHEACGKLYQRYALLYDAGAEGRNANKNSIPERFAKRAEQELTEAGQIREEFGKGSAAQNKPSIQKSVVPYPAWTTRR